MSRFSRRRALLRAFTLLTGGTVVGCRLQRAPLVQRTFRLQFSAPTSGTRPVGDSEGVLLVRPFQVAASVESRSFLIRRGEAEFAVDSYNGFLLSPGVMLAEAVSGWVRGLGVYRVVTTGGSQVTPTQVLEGEVRELWGDYRVPSSPKAVLSLTVRLLQPRAGDPPQIQWEQTESREVPMAKAGPDDLVTGWNLALDQIAKVLEGRMRPGKLGAIALPKWVESVGRDLPPSSRTRDFGGTGRARRNWAE